MTTKIARRSTDDQPERRATDKENMMTKELDEARAQAAALFPVGSRDGEAISSTILADMEKLK